MTCRFTTRWTPALALFALVAACDSPTDLSPITVQSVTIGAVGDAVQLVAHGVGDALPRWESLDTTIVTVTPAGMAVAVRSGTATVRARLGSRTNEGTVTVLPSVDVRLSNVRVVTDEQGQTGLSMQVTNVGGRGYYRIEMWKAAAEGGTEHRRINWQTNDNEAGAGMTFGVTYWTSPTPTTGSLSTHASPSSSSSTGPTASGWTAARPARCRSGDLADRSRDRHIGACRVPIIPQAPSWRS